MPAPKSVTANGALRNPTAQEPPRPRKTTTQNHICDHLRYLRSFYKNPLINDSQQTPFVSQWEPQISLMGADVHRWRMSSRSRVPTCRPFTLHVTSSFIVPTSSFKNSLDFPPSQEYLNPNGLREVAGSSLVFRNVKRRRRSSPRSKSNRPNLQETV